MAAKLSSPPSFTPRRKWTVGFNVAVRTVVVFAVVVMTNYLAGKIFHREYLSAHTQTELAPRTVNLVESLTNEVKVTVYYDREDELFTTLTALLREYSALNPRIRIEIVDYLRDAAAAQQVKRKYSLPEATKDEEKNFIIFECEGRWKPIPGRALADYDLRINKEKKSYEQPPTLLKAEAFFNGCLLAVSSAKPLKAYVLQGHGEHSIASGDEVTGYLDFKSVLEQNYIKVEALDLKKTDTVPKDCNLLVVPGPQSAISDGELEKIEQYLDEGGRMFALFNSISTERRATLEKILARWGVLVGEAVVQDPRNSLNTLRSKPGVDVTVGAFSEHPAVRSLIGFNLNLIMPRPIVPITSRERNPETPKVEVLFATEETATLINDASGQTRRYPLAVAVERAPVAGVLTGRGTTRMILVGDSYFLANGPMKIGANRAFAGYAINWLLERPQLMSGIEPRPIAEFRIALTVAQMQTVQWLLLGALPGGILLFGGLVWWRRQK